jgi:hypothetical protein
MPTGVAVTTLTPITSAKMNLKLETVNGSDIVTVADANVIGGVPVVHRIAIADAAGNTDLVLTNKTKIIEAWAIKAGNNGGAGDTVKLYNLTDTTDITDAMVLNINDKLIVRAISIDDAHDTIAAGNTLRIITAKVTHCNCVVFVLGLVVV